jgi:hypothetical protein
MDVIACFNKAMNDIQRHSMHKERSNWQAL